MKTDRFINENRNKIYFISGIDTNIGKSYATGYIAKDLLSRGYNVITQKLIQTGCCGIAEDIILHREIMGCDLHKVDRELITSPYVLSHPSSPHLSAKLDGVEVDISKIDGCTDRLSSMYDIVLIEGAGGIMVPILEDYLIIDYIKERGLDVILVTSSRLGSINHTLLTIEACIGRDIKISAIIYNRFDSKDEIIADDTYSYLERYLKRKKIDSPLIDWPNN